MNPQTDEQLVTALDQPAVWMSVNLTAPNLRQALSRAAELSEQGQSPYPLKDLDDTTIDHAQMLRLWERLGLVPPG
jgi:hypothetical protein